MYASMINYLRTTVDMKTIIIAQYEMAARIEDAEDRDPKRDVYKAAKALRNNNIIKYST